MLRPLLAGLALLAALLQAPVRAAEAPALRVALTQEPDSVNPLTGTLMVDNDVFALLYNGLTRFDDRGVQIPDVAEAVPTPDNGGISRDGKLLTYIINANAHWHDGRPITSADVAFSLAAYRNPKIAAGGINALAQIDRILTPNARTVRILLKRPWAPALAAFAGGSNGVILPAHLLEREADLNRVDFEHVDAGSGPYVLTAWNRGSDMTFDANPSYFQGAPHIARLRLIFFPNDNTMMVAIRAGDIDVADNVSVATYSAVRAFSTMRAAWNARSSWDHITFNMAREPLSDVRVRRALCYGFDENAVFGKIYRGLGARGPVAENPRMPWYNRRLRYYSYDAGEAGRLLDAAGWRRMADGSRSKSGRKLSVTLATTAGNQTREQVEIFLQNAWKQLGVDVVIKNAPAAVLYAPAGSGGALYGGTFDIALNGVISPSDPSLLDINGSAALPPHGQNFSRFVRPEVDRLEEEAASTYVITTRKRLYDRIQEIELQQLPYYVLRWNQIVSLYVLGVSGVRPSMTESTFWNISSWTR